MRITRIETLLAPKQVVVQVFTDDGLTGIGQTALRNEEVTAAVLHKMVAPVFLGQNPWDLQVLARQTLTKHYKFTGTFLYRALCGVETAVWDLLGKAVGQPVYQLLGGAIRTEIPVYASSLSREITPEQEAQRMTDLVSQYGFRCVKIKIGGRMGLDTDAAPGRTERIIPLMREALGDAIHISADANSAFSTHKAIKIGRLLEQYNYFHFEEPCPFAELENTALVADALDIPVAGGEQDNSLHHFKRMIDRRAVDIVQCDIGYIGGLSRARKVAEMAEMAGIPCTPHCPNRSLLQVFNLHLTAAMPACYHYQEWRADTDQPWAEEIYEPLPEVVDGKVALSNRPGWGVTLQPGYLKKAEVHVSRLEA
jgi:L-alanine-DL-glutamate epimerase-like enolase superfamily enzyme